MRRKIANWQVWTVPAAVLALMLAIEVAAVAVPAAVSAPITLSNVWMAALLASLSIGYSIDRLTSEAARTALTARRGALPFSLLATWTFPAAILLPVRLSCAVVIVAMICEWPVRNIAGTAQLYRHVYTAACVLIAVESAGGIMANSWPPGIRLAVAALCYAIVETSSLAVAVGLSTGFPSLRFMLNPRMHVNELLTISVGIAEVLCWRAHVPLIWLSLPIAIGIQRVAMRSEIRETGPKDCRTMSQKVWTTVATEVINACATGSVLRIDTNDPRAAATVAQLQAGCDAIGTVGKSGLAILLADCPGPNADSLALRLRSVLGSSGIAANVAVAAKPRDGQSLDELLAVSEAELITRDAATRSAKSVRPDAVS
jgi:hypothetical protein